MNLNMNDQEILLDSLMSQKQIGSGYNTYAGECANISLRNAMLNILDEEHNIQSDIFSYMNTHGMYPTEAAEQTKIDQAKQKFSPAQ